MHALDSCVHARHAVFAPPLLVLLILAHGVGGAAAHIALCALVQVRVFPVHMFSMSKTEKTRTRFFQARNVSHTFSKILSMQEGAKVE
jgi:hypothetical protein